MKITRACTAVRLRAAATALLCVLSAGVLASPTLDERMQRFQDGSLRGFALSALRGDGSEPDSEPYTDADFRDLAATGANVVRVPIHLRRCDGCTAWTSPEPDIRYVERVLDQGARLGFRVVVVLQPEPWGHRSDYWAGGDSALLKADMVQQWGRIAQRLRSHAALQAYDLVNEPVVQGPPALWQDLATRLARAVRQHDPDTPVMVEPSPWGLPGGMAKLQPLDLPGVVYSFHLYNPHAFTHQGLPGYAEAQPYPGHGWDRQRLAQAMDEARRFAARHQAPIFIGEFSCVRWAPAGSCPRYLADAVSLFRAERWGWAYHCWRCYTGWDAELRPDLPQGLQRDQAAGERRADSPALQVLKAAMKR
jgi:sugar phosphate isomerase/epimerase